MAGTSDGSNRKLSRAMGALFALVLLALVLGWVAFRAFVPEQESSMSAGETAGESEAGDDAATLGSVLATSTGRSRDTTSSEVMERPLNEGADAAMEGGKLPAPYLPGGDVLTR